MLLWRFPDLGCLHDEQARSQVRKEAFSHRIVVSTALRTHAGQYSGTCHLVAIFLAAIDGVLIGVVDQARLRCAMRNRHVQNSIDWLMGW
ncbi:MAG: hypothetical protein M3Q16_09185 [Pseudomonadota bacterium]|nr:hypothetical protein [Pseudomonadota bacterium]